MSSLSLYTQSPQALTLVPNAFIDCYLADANDAQVKLYLYLLRYLPQGNLPSLAKISDIFNYTERDVLRSLRYWEGKGLLSLEYDQAGDIVSIELLEAAPAASGPHLIPTAPGRTLPQESTASPSGAEKAVCARPLPTALDTDSPAAFAGQNAAAPELAQPAEEAEDASDKVSPAPISPSEPPPSGEHAYALFLAETYMGRPLSSQDMRSVLYIVEDLGFDKEMLDYMLQECVDRNTKSIRYLEKMAQGLADKGIRTPKEAMEDPGFYEKEVYEILRSLGRREHPTPAEAAYPRRWLREYGFPMDVISEACQRACVKSSTGRLALTEGILRDWRSKGVRHLGNVQALDRQWADKQKPQEPPKTPRGRAAAFGQFSRNQYDFAAMEQEL